MNKLKILLVEDNRILREGIKALINAQPDLKVVAASEGDHDTLQQVRNLKAQVVLLDLGLKNENGLDVVKALTTEMPQTKVIGMGLIPSQLDIIEIVEAGAAGFILKDASIADFLETIRLVARGKKSSRHCLQGRFSIIWSSMRGGGGRGRCPKGCG